MKMLRQLTFLLALSLAPFAFGASAVTQSAVTYSIDGAIMTAAAGETIEIPDGSSFELIRGAISVTGTASINAGNGTAAVQNGSMFVQVQGDKARVSNIGDGSSQVTFTEPSGDVTEVDVGAEIFSALQGTDTVVIEVDDNDFDLPDFDVDPNLPVGSPI